MSESAPQVENHNSFTSRFWVGPFDLRTTGLFRIVFGIATLAAVIDLAPVLFPLLSDEGVMPRSALLAGVARANRFSLFDFAGPFWILVSLWLLTIAALVAYIAGFRTRLASVASFFLVTGLHERNLAVFDGADNVIRLLLFWSMFMDLGGRYSLDAVRRSRAGLPRRDYGWAFPVRMAQLQFAWIYPASVVWKLQGKYWIKGEALRFALGLDHLFTRQLGAALFDARWFIMPASYYTLAVEGTFLLLVFAPFWQPKLKAIGLFTGISLHGGIWLLMNVGNFCYVMMSIFALFVEPDWAAWIVQVARRFLRWLFEPQPRARMRALAEAALARFPLRPPWVRWPERFPSLHRGFRIAVPPLCGALLLSCMWFSLPEAVTRRPMPGWLHDAVQELEVWQSWDMFAPDPMNTDSWLKGTGTLTDGTEVDVLRGNDGGPLPSIFPHFYFSRWTKFMNTLAYGDQTNLLYFGKFICRSWNEHAPQGRKPLKTFKVYRVERRTPELEKPPPEWSEVLILGSRVLLRSTVENASERRAATAILTSALFIGAGLRLWLCLKDNGMYWPDEIYQSIEPAHIKVFGYGFRAWEFVDGTRHWALPLVIATVLKVCTWLGLSSPYQYVPIVRVLFASTSTAAAWGTYRLARASGASSLSAAIGGSFCSLLGLLVYFSPRALSETAVELPIVLGLAFALEPEGSLRRFRIGLCLLGASVMLRLHCVFFCAGALAVLAARKDLRRFSEGVAILSFWGVVLGLVDRLTWGGWFHSAIAYARFSVLEHGANHFGVAPFHYYFTALWRSTGSAGLLIGALALLGAVRARGLFFISFGTFLVYCCISHKELRFVVPILPLFCALAAVGLDWVGDRIPDWARTSAATFALSAALGSALVFHRLTFGDLGNGRFPATQNAYDAYGSINRLLMAASNVVDLCGLKIDPTAQVWTGGYTYLHRQVPLYGPSIPSLDSSFFNYAISESVPEGIQPVATDGDDALWRTRDGGCTPDPSFTSRFGK